MITFSFCLGPSVTFSAFTFRLLPWVLCLLHQDDDPGPDLGGGELLYELRLPLEVGGATHRRTDVPHDGRTNEQVFASEEP